MENFVPPNDAIVEEKKSWTPPSDAIVEESKKKSSLASLPDYQESIPEDGLGGPLLPSSSLDSNTPNVLESESTSTEILKPVGGYQYADPNKPNSGFIKPPVPKATRILTDREMKEFTPEEQKKFTTSLPDLILANKSLLIDSPNAEANRKKFYEGQAQGDLKAGDIEAIGEEYAKNIKDIALYTEKIKTNPEDYNSRIGMAQNLTAIGHTKAANVILDSMMEQRPDYIPSYQQSALIKAKQENYPAAIGTLDVGIQNNPNDAILYSNRAALKAKTGDTQGAVKDLDIGISKTENPHALELMYTQRAQVFKSLAADKTLAQKYIELIQESSDPNSDTTDQEYFNERYQDDLAMASKLAVRNAGPEKYKWYSADKKVEGTPEPNTGIATTEVSESVQLPSDEAQVAALNKKYREITNPSPGIENYVVGFLEDTNESVVSGLEKVGEAVTREGEAFKNALEGKITPNELTVESTKAFVQALSGLTSSALGVAMHVTPTGLAFTGGMKVAEQSESTKDLTEFLMAPVSAIWQPETKDGQNVASLFDVVIGGMLIHGVSKGIKGAPEVAEKIQNKEPITKEDVPIIVEATTEVIKDPEAKVEIEKQFGLEPKSPEQIASELKVQAETLAAQEKPQEVVAKEVVEVAETPKEGISTIENKVEPEVKFISESEIGQEQSKAATPEAETQTEGIINTITDNGKSKEGQKETSEKVTGQNRGEEKVTPVLPELNPETPKAIPESELSGIKKSLVPESEVSKIDIEKRTTQQMLDSGKEIVDSGEVDPVSLTSEIANGNAKALQPKEVSALVYYKAKLDKSLNEAYKEASEAASSLDTEAQFSAQAKISALEKQLTDYHTMSVKTAYEQSLAFRLRKMLLDSEYNLQSQIAKYKAENNGVIPAEVEAKFRQYDKELKEAQDRLNEAEERAKKAEGDLAIKNIKEANDRNIKDVRRDQKIREASKRLANKIREGKLSRPDVFSSASPASIVWDGALEVIARTIESEPTIAIAQAVARGWSHIKNSEWYKSQEETIKNKAKEKFDEYAKSYEKDVDAIPGKLKIPQSVIRDFVERGIDNIEELTAAVKDFIKEEYPNATERDVRDAITGYGKTINLSKDEINVQIRKIKRVGKLISGIEDARNKQRPLRSGLQRDRLTKEEMDMQRELKGLLKDLPFEESDMAFKQKSALDSMKTKIASRITELEKKIADKDFSAKPIKKVIRLDDEVIRAKAELEKVKEKYDLEQEKNKLQQQSTAKKFWDIGKDAVLSIPKSLQASWDMSAPFRQGLINTMRPSRIKYTEQEFKTMFEHAFSEKKADDWLRYIKSSPEYPLMKSSGLFLSEANAKLSAREEIYKSNLVQRIPYLKHLFKGSERAYNGFLNMQRVNEFLRVAETFKKDGIDPTTPEGSKVYKAWANYVNNATGRGSLGKFEMAANDLSDVFFSPRLIAARFNVLYPPYYAKMPKAARMEALKSTFEFIGTGLTAIGLAKLAGADVETDPRSSNFGKIKIGDTTLDIWGGFIQWVRMLAQVATNERKSTSSGKINKLGEGYGSDTRVDVIVNFFKNKLAPTPALVARLAESKFKEDKGETKIVSQFGEETTISEEALDQVIPLYLQDIDDLAKEHDPSTLTGLMLASFFGFGVQQYKPRKDASKKDDIK